MTDLKKYLHVLGRALLGLPLLVTGLQKLDGIDGAQALLLDFGIPLMVLPLVIALIIGGATAVVLGWKTNTFALAFAGFLFLTAVFMHGDLADPVERLLFFKDLALGGGFLLIFADGPGALSLDTRRPIEG